MEPKITSNSQNKSEEKTKPAAARFPNVKPSYKVIVIKTTSYWYEDRHIDQWNKLKSPHI